MRSQAITPDNHSTEMITPTDPLIVRAKFFNPLVEDVEECRDDLNIILAGGGGASNKYTDIINLNAGIITIIVTTLISVPYSIMLFDAFGNNLSDTLLSRELVGGVYVLKFYSVNEKLGCNLYILY